jgi:GDPmannose 4,6-dehydratase
MYSYWLVINYREAYGIHASNGILFNHESPRRGPTFVTRKTTMAVARISKGMQECPSLGNLNAERDWGHAKDYVEGMWRIVQAEKPDDFVLATNRTTSVRAFVEACFKHVGIEIEWQGKDAEEVGINKANGKTVVRVDPRYYRPTEVDLLIGDASKAKEKLGWEPTYNLEMLVDDMMKHDVEACGQTNLKW